jgi:hypothetical protein
MSLRPASRDRSDTARSGNGNPVVRQMPSIRRQTTTTQSDKLPSYLRSLHHIRPARPSMVSSEPGSDVQNDLIDQTKHLEASRSIFSSQCRQNTQPAKADRKTFISSEDKFRCDPPIQARGRRPSLAGPSGAQRQRRDSVRTKYGGAERDRTADPLLAKQVLSQLSYSPIQLDRHPDLTSKRLGNITHQPIQVCHPYRTIARRMAPSRRAGPKVRTARECKANICVSKWWARVDSNYRPHAYQACALTN